MAGMDDIIGSNPLVQQMVKAGIPLSALARQSPAAVGFQPDLQIPPMPPAPNRSPMANTAPLNTGAPSPATNPAIPQVKQPKPQPAINPEVYHNEGQQIIAALVKRLEAITKVETTAKKEPGAEKKRLLDLLTLYQRPNERR
jgi:hypothetical protein